jgi:hypothetical protein
MSVSVSAITFLLILGGIFLGAFLRDRLPEHHLSKESEASVRLGVGVVATIAALVLGLLIAGAKSSFDTQNGQVKQITADIILLDKFLAAYGPDTLLIRRQMRGAVGPFADELWDEREMGVGGSLSSKPELEQIFLAVQALSPPSDVQRALQTRASQISNDVAQMRSLLFVESDNPIPAAFLGVLAFWLVIIFASFSLFSPLNSTVFAFFCLFALSASAAIFLILELNRPFGGLMAISSGPLRNALGPLGP